ncbi:MFS transporter [Bacillus infantis]|uniref:MFS transporter n=1 Tax=Bacillus infantis TaxID=324767 RepID=UPI00301AA2DE
MGHPAAVQKQKYNEGTAYKVLFIIGLCHLLNDTIQAVVPAMFPILEKSMGLTYTELGFIAFSLNIVSSLLQPVTGILTDRKPMPFALPIGLAISLAGVLGLALAGNFLSIVLSVVLIGLGSAIFHPEGSRVAYMAAGTKRGLAQSIYQVGGNTGQALAPLITALILVPLGQRGASWFTLAAALASGLLVYIAFWYSGRLKEEKQLGLKKSRAGKKRQTALKKKIVLSLAVILFLIFARSWYISAITNFYAFYAITEYSFTITQAQVFLFAFLAAGAAGTFFGGPLSDRFGKKRIIFVSMAASAPFSILLPYMPKELAFIFLLLTGFILMASFSVTVVYAQELVPGKIGTMSGLTVGLAFGMGAIGSVALGWLADMIGLPLTLAVTGFLPLLGLLSAVLPSDRQLAEMQAEDI